MIDNLTFSRLARPAIAVFFLLALASCDDSDNSPHAETTHTLTQTSDAIMLAKAQMIAAVIRPADTIVAAGTLIRNNKALSVFAPVVNTALATQKAGQAAVTAAPIPAALSTALAQIFVMHSIDEKSLSNTFDAYFMPPQQSGNKLIYSPAIETVCNNKPACTQALSEVTMEQSLDTDASGSIMLKYQASIAASMAYDPENTSIIIDLEKLAFITHHLSSPGQAKEPLEHNMNGQGTIQIDYKASDETAQVSLTLPDELLFESETDKEVISFRSEAGTTIDLSLDTSDTLDPVLHLYFSLAPLRAHHTTPLSKLLNNVQSMNTVKSEHIDGHIITRGLDEAVDMTLDIEDIEWVLSLREQSIEINRQETVLNKPLRLATVPEQPLVLLMNAALDIDSRSILSPAIPGNAIETISHLHIKATQGTLLNLEPEEKDQGVWLEVMGQNGHLQYRFNDRMVEVAAGECLAGTAPEPETRHCN